MFDITKLAASETSTVELVGRDDAPLHDADCNRLSITVYGPGTRIGLTNYRFQSSDALGNAKGAE